MDGAQEQRIARPHFAVQPAASAVQNNCFSPPRGRHSPGVLQIRSVRDLQLIRRRLRPAAFSCPSPSSSSHTNDNKITAKSRILYYILPAPSSPNPMSFKILTVCAKLKEGERAWPRGTGERQLGQVLELPLSQLSKHMVHPEWPHGRVVGLLRTSWQQTHDRGDASAESASPCLVRSCG